MADVNEKREVSTEDIQRLCQIVEEFLPPEHGFIVFAFPTGDNVKDPYMRYASNCQRESVIVALKEWMIQRGFHEDWMDKYN